MSNLRRIIGGLLVGSMLLLLPTMVVAQNGNTCATAVVITENGTFQFNSTGASGDDPCAPGIPTVWFRFVAPEAGVITADLCGSSFDTYLTVFAGANCPLACAGRVAENDDFCDLQSGVTFNAVDGQTYHFAISGYDATEFGPGVLNFAFTPQSDDPGDNCLNPVEITDNGSYPFDTTGRSLDEPCSYGQMSPTFWFRYVAPTAGVINASSCPGGVATFDNTLVAHITDGSCPVNCSTAVAGQDLCGFDPGEFGIEFFVEAGDTVYLTVSGFEVVNVGSGDLSFTFTPIVAGDTCAEAAEIVANGAYDFDTTDATADDPCREVIGDVWYKFTAVEDGSVTVDLCGTVFDAYLNVFAGAACPASCDDLLVGDEMACLGASSELKFDVATGETFYFSISGQTVEDKGAGVLNFAFAPVNAGDTCGEAPTITENGIYPFNNTGASQDDPCRATSPTVWYSYTASANGDLLVETCGLATFDTFVSVFEGDCPVSCDNRIGFNDDGAVPDCGLRSSLTVPLTNGQTYKIALSGFGAAAGGGEVLIQFTESAVMLGDINGDGVINVADVTELANLIAAGNEPDVAVGDVNDDGVVNELDVEALAGMIVE